MMDYSHGGTIKCRYFCIQFELNYFDLQIQVQIV